jgi:hypothetical protein
MGLRNSRLRLLATHAGTIPAFKIGTENEPFPVCVLVGCYSLRQDESKDRGRMHMKSPDRFACS